MRIDLYRRVVIVHYLDRFSELQVCGIADSAIYLNKEKLLSVTAVNDAI